MKCLNESILAATLASGCLLAHCAAWTTKQSFTVASRSISYTNMSRRSRQSKCSLVMRDRSSSYWFQVGDKVKVVASDVRKGGVNLQYRVGKVVETWQKCDVDPTCCCAEQVEADMAVRVEFQGSLYDESIQGVSFDHYFAEEELQKCSSEERDPATENRAFDGMSCVAFKLDHLKMGEQAQRLAAFEASKQTGDD